MNIISNNKIHLANTLILFTNSYPYNAARENTFLDEEIAYLASRFQKVVIIPSNLSGSRVSVPTNVEVEETFGVKQQSKHRHFKALFQVILSPIFWDYIAKKPLALQDFRELTRIIAVLGDAIRTYKWLHNYIQKSKIDVSDTVFYTYWLGPETLGIGLLKTFYPMIYLVSRAHGSDLYEYRHNPPVIPFRKLCLKYIDQLFLISNNGKQYVTEHYPWFKERCEVKRLGVKSPNFMTNPSTDGIYRIVSCSYMIPLKRLDLLIKGLRTLAIHHPTHMFKWTHIGNGPMWSEVKKEVQDIPTNMQVQLLGELTNDEVMSYYKNNSVDVFINVSKYEGISVSIMEAESCGIPVIATAVGGSNEIVFSENGKLLSEDPTPKEIAEAIFEVVHDSKKVKEMKLASKQVWQNYYNSETNFQEFSDRLIALPQKSNIH